MSENKSISSNFVRPGSHPRYNPDRPIKLNHIALDIALDFENQILAGKSILSGKILNSGIERVWLNAVDMEIKEVLVNETKADFNYDGQKIEVFIPFDFQADEKIEIQTTYKTQKPKLGVTFVVPDKDYPEKPLQAWTQGESEGSRYWYPCFDFPKNIVTSEIFIRVPSGLVTVSNGLLQSTEEVAKHDDILNLLDIETESYEISHWKQSLPHPNYLMTFAVGEFDKTVDTWNGIDVLNYGPKGSTEMMIATGGKLPQMLEFFSGIFGVTYTWAT
jgi:aminopeptidase N